MQEHSSRAFKCCQRSTATLSPTLLLARRKHTTPCCLPLQGSIRQAGLSLRPSDALPSSHKLSLALKKVLCISSPSSAKRLSLKRVFHPSIRRRSLRNKVCAFHPTNTLIGNRRF
ncbi:hypothetical protein EMPS_05203 [Entomortierella parvispora]|uniref:Uncharacterized protein n=1 Tax=Entomortierella parvispora TaxID=205924 RepID=A0A9P3HAA7_9FUNG|nr:hypothetical protein EMPS_05203 [Entomortierella parvispora]